MVTITTIYTIIIREKVAERNYKSVNFQLKFEVNNNMNKKSALLNIPGSIENTYS